MSKFVVPMHSHCPLAPPPDALTTCSFTVEHDTDLMVIVKSPSREKTIMSLAEVEAHAYSELGIPMIALECHKLNPKTVVQEPLGDAKWTCLWGCVCTDSRCLFYSGWLMSAGKAVSAFDIDQTSPTLPLTAHLWGTLPHHLMQSHIFSRIRSISF